MVERSISLAQELASDVALEQSTSWRNSGRCPLSILESQKAFSNKENPVKSNVALIKLLYRHSRSKKKRHTHYVLHAEKKGAHTNNILTSGD
mmetsp:Transcript_18324/g.44137  ORF Transcript_18324/g.44137 Transcript_18324/m.44137 type:complete len:92 (+) Transcript_18324:220-495(+)